MSNRTETGTPDVITIPLNKLKKSPKNVRKIPHIKADIEALAASIAALGMLQFPVVEPELSAKNKPTGFYLVNAGEGRRLAQLLRFKRKQIKSDAPVRCVLDTEHSATEISLAENAVRTEMHPADQYEAFAKLHNEDGLAAEDIAARFGVTAAVVRQRLKLGAVSPKLMALYRRDEMSLNQLSAFAITDDHERQERVWSNLSLHNRSRHAILAALSEGQIPSDDRRALFVGEAAYEKAGGAIIRDLFDAEGGGFFADAALLDRLAREKLQGEADAIAAEGWRWIKTDIEFDHEATASLRRVFPKASALSKADRQRLRKLEIRYDAICERYPNGEPSPADAGKLERIQTAIDALQKQEYRQKDIGIAGAFVSLAQDGCLRVDRGLVRSEDEPKEKDAQNGKGDPKNGERAKFSDKLIAELSAHRTTALRNELALHPDIALTALLHSLVWQLYFYDKEHSCLQISITCAALDGHAPGVGESLAERQIVERHTAWGARMPSEKGELWSFLQTLPDEERMALLAHCVAMSVYAVQTHGAEPNGAIAHADTLAHAVGLNMSVYWQAKAANYFTRISKDCILEALREGCAGDVEAIARLKKPAMAEAAEAALSDKNWLPVLLRHPPQLSA
ncbi:MAG TPA: ParB N-terminal domain-containing protein [Xanthobacteraceae bacterium]|jgi:ParB family chromosome partitioning protein|nr:ParB N-terminal domain-containing protein [Xanthobacteraceae bacterium]